jgi:hypothetical protein
MTSFEFLFIRAFSFSEQQDGFSTELRRDILTLPLPPLPLSCLKYFTCLTKASQITAHIGGVYMLKMQM